MKLGVVIYSNDPETVWNAFRLGILALSCGDDVTVFLLAEGVEVESLDTTEFGTTDKMGEFAQKGGRMFSCGTCMSLRNQPTPKNCQSASMGALYEMIKNSDKVITL
ncbi:MAG: DsrE family protein [Acidiferrobacterales bacterium]